MAPEMDYALFAADGKRNLVRRVSGIRRKILNSLRIMLAI